MTYATLTCLQIAEHIDLYKAGLLARPEGHDIWYWFFNCSILV
jgi:hypothetical protein